ncbi:MAG TPA: dienelactone hydrolase family protein [Acidimicrobiia bacterium]|nr:dienelactone hydrolase family protein [Acidimicrobiia bacterium]
MGENIAFGTTGGYLATPEMGAGPALIVIQERESPPGHGRDVCDRFAAEGFTALAPELRNGHTAADLAAAIDLLKPHPAVRGQGVGVVGFGLGAGLALWLATSRPDDVVAVVPFYGTVPEGVEHPDWSRLSAAVQGHFGEEDPACPPQAVSALESALGEAGVSVEMFVYPLAGAGFFDDTRPDAHVEDAARQAWIRTLEFLRKHLG